MGARVSDIARRVLLLAAHPNDEFALVATLRAAVSRGDEVWAAWFAADDRADIRALREAESARVMEAIGVPAARCIHADLPALILPMQLGGLVSAVRSLGERIVPDATYVPAYEGGHPDHDALSFAAWESLSVLGEIREYPIYRKARSRRLLSRVPRYARMLPGMSEPETTWLSAADTAFKRDVWKMYRSQRPLTDILLMMSGDERRFFGTEQTRSLPLRDYTKPPHERPLLYEERTDGAYSFEEFASSVRRYMWDGGVTEEPL